MTIPLVVSGTAFALIDIPSDFGPRLDDWEVVMLWGSTVGSLIGGAVLAGHFGQRGVSGAFRSAIAMLMALVIGGSIGGGAMGAVLPPFAANGPAIGFVGFGGIAALFSALGMPLYFGWTPWGLPITLAGILAAHLAGRVRPLPGGCPPFWHLLLVPLLPAAALALGLWLEAAIKA